ncbi:ABC transporter ATP-binding protein [Thalassospira sp.]|uniref:ABC transporter ATP-binding protein n=1 Tax=Thalassospira sp. TaxID=1912094 RepID=UPI0027343061|nr:sn-glycerol-3-phosphate ABC transporter ATP-binding protein UgpC [Thalassospira sp.]MDP2697939.1 sn-glycerol-3-phosphate ABC transporter ATP-binding protein UgpC [Thalassospira sp.]
MADLKLDQIRKSYGAVDVLHGVDLDVKDGEFVVFVGPSGCGKSTLLRIIAGLEDITGGDLMIDGDIVNTKSPRDRGIAMVFQSYALYPHMSVYKNMAFGLKLAKTNKAELDERVRNAAKILQLDALLDRRPAELSGGQRQRVAIGRAIVRQPKVFLFDEPLSNLDAALRVQTRIEIAKLHQKLKSTIIYVTHDQIEAMTLADKIVVLNAGNVEQVGSPMELYHHPKTRFVAGFIGSPAMNFTRVTITAVEPGRVTVQTPGGKSAVLPFEVTTDHIGTEVELGIRPEHMGLDRAGELGVDGEVEVVEKLGDSVYLYVRLANGDRVTLRAPGHCRIKIGEAVSARADAAAAHLFDRNGQAFAKLDCPEEYSAME